MKRSKFIVSTVAVLLVLLLLFAAVVFAGTYRSPSKDGTGDGTAFYNDLIEIQSSGSIGGGTCAPVYVGYIGWDLSSETATWAEAKLTMYAYETVGGEQPMEFTVYPVNDESWTETGGTDPGYDSNTPLAVASADLSGATQANMKPIVFQSADLGNYFLNKKGQSSASVAVVMTNGCGQIQGDVKFEDREGTGGSAPQSTNEPDLIFITSNAVSLSSFTADSGQPNWPLIAALVALVAVVVAGITYGVRRSSHS